jgi:hypothetical protein
MNALTMNPAAQGNVGVAVFFAADFVFQADGASVRSRRLAAQTARCSAEFSSTRWGVNAPRDCAALCDACKGCKRINQPHGERLLEHFANHHKGIG